MLAQSDEQTRAKVALEALKGGDGAYLADVERLLGLDGALMASLQQAHELLTLLRQPDYERVWWLAQNPGMLSDMIRVYQREKSLPRSRSRLLEKAIEARLLDERAKRTGDPARFRQEIKFEVLPQVAFEIMKDQGLSMAQEEILSLFALHHNLRQEEAEPLLQELIFRDGLLVEKAAQRYGFIRQPYQEFFAARQLRQQWLGMRENEQDPLQAMQPFWQPRYWAVTAMMAGLLPQKEAMWLITHLRQKQVTQPLAALCMQNVEALPDAFIADFVASIREAIMKMLGWAAFPGARWLKLDAFLFNRQLRHQFETLRELGPYAKKVIIEIEEQLANNHRLSDGFKEAIEWTWAANLRTGQQLSIADCTKAIEQNPHEASHYQQRGDAYSQRGEYALAIADYSQAIKLNPNTLTYTNRAFAYLRQGEYQHARDDYTQALAFNPSNETAHTGRGITLWRQEQAFQTAYRDGLAHRQQGEHLRGITSFTQAIALKATSASPHPPAPSPNIRRGGVKRVPPLVLGEGSAGRVAETMIKPAYYA